MKNTRIKRLVALALCALTLSAFAPVMAQEDVPTVTVLLSSWSGTMPPEKNFVIDTINETLGINFVPNMCATGDDYNNRLATLTAAGNLPDILYGDRAKLKEYYENGVVMPLDDLLYEYGQDILFDKEGYFGGYTFGGKIYGIPRDSAEGLQTTMLAIRKDWLDKLGMEVPTTVDEFYDAMYAFTYSDPDGNGVDDTCGLCVSMNSGSTYRGLFDAFGISVRYANFVDGKVVDWFTHPNFIEVIKVYNRMYREGLMEPDFVTIPWIDAFNNLMAGKYGAMNFGPIGTTNNWHSRYLEDPKPDWVYVRLDGGVGDSGFDIAHADVGDCVAINAKCANPEAAMRLLNWAVTEEGQDLLILGQEGKHYASNEAGPVTWLSPYAEDITLQRNEGGYAYCGLMGSLKNCATTRKNLNLKTIEALEFGVSEGLDTVAVLYETPEIQLESGGIMDSIRTEAFAALTVTEGDIEQEYQAFLEKYMLSGGETWIEQATEIYLSQIGG